MSEIRFYLIENWKCKVLHEIQTTRSIAPLNKIDIKGSFAKVNLFSWKDKGLIYAKASLCAWTNDRMLNWHENNNIKCPFCDSNDSIDHRIFHCITSEALRVKYAPTVEWALSQSAFTRAFGL